MNEIWILVTIRLKENKFFDCRSWFWFPNQEDAVASLTLNQGPSFYCENGYYSYAVIEKISYENQIEREEMWFKLSSESAIPCQRPEEVRNIINFSIG